MFISKHFNGNRNMLHNIGRGFKGIKNNQRIHLQMVRNIYFFFIH